MKRMLMAGLVACSALSQANLIVNGSFEDGTFSPNGQNTMSLFPGATDMTGWTTGIEEIAWIGDPNPFGFTASDGAKSLDLIGYHDYQPCGSVSQAFTTNAGWSYRVTFDVGHVSQVVVSAAGDQASFWGTVGGNDPWWITRSWVFTAAGALTTLSFQGGPETASIYAGLDRVIVEVEAVPEPGTLAVVGLGGLALLRRRRAH